MKNSMRYLFCLSVLLLAACGKDLQSEVRDPFDVPDRQGMTVKGTVVDGQDAPVVGVIVSDGLLTAVTDSNGQYWLASDLAKRRFIQVTIPSGYEIPAEKGLPLFFERIPEGVASFRADFKLRSRGDAGERYTVLMTADPQIRKRTAAYDNFAYHSLDMYDDMCLDLMRTRRAITDRPVYGICLGDLIHNDMGMYHSYCKGLEGLDFPVFNVIGNHDHIQYAATDAEAVGKFEEFIGPTNYSVDLGRIHFVFLDNIIMKDNAASGEGLYSYGLSDGVYSWLCNDLKHVSKDRILMVCAHSAMLRKPAGDPSDTDRNGKNYARVLSQYKYVHAWAGHAHTNFNYVYASQEQRYPAFESHIVARSTGALWLNEQVSNDGTPRGYYVIDIDGENIAWRYKTCGFQNGLPTGIDQECQIRAYAPGDYADRYVYANVWAWDSLWSEVRYTDSGKKSAAMSRIRSYDKAYREACDKSNAIPENLAVHEFSAPEDVTHLFRIAPSANATSCIIETTDRFGKRHSITLDWSATASSE